MGKRNRRKRKIVNANAAPTKHAVERFEERFTCLGGDGKTALKRAARACELVGQYEDGVQEYRAGYIRFPVVDHRIVTVYMDEQEFIREIKRIRRGRGSKSRKSGR